MHVETTQAACFQRVQRGEREGDGVNAKADGMSDLSHGVVRALRPAGVVSDSMHHHAAAASAGSLGGFAASGYVPQNHLPATSDLRRRVTDDEIQLLALLADGLPVEAIARRLALSDRTVRRRSRALCDRLGARAPIQVVAWAARNGLI